MKLTSFLIGIVLAAGCGPVGNVNVSTNSAGSNAQAAASPPASATPAPVDATPSPAVSPGHPAADTGDVQAAAEVIEAYYAAINSGDFRRAYELWSGNGEASGQTFERFKSGFAGTASSEVRTETDSVTIEGAAGSRFATIPVSITARTKSGTEQRFKGEYVLRRSVVDGATAEQRAWHIYSASIHEEK